VAPSSETDFRIQHSAFSIPPTLRPVAKRQSTASKIKPLRLVVWTDRTRVPLVRDTIAAGGDGIQLVGVAAVDAAQSASLADELGAEPIRELRHALPDEGVDAIWLAADGELARDTVRWLRQLRVVVVATEPQPSSLDELEDAQSPGIDGLLSWRAGSTWGAAMDVLTQFGRPDAVSIVAVGTPAHGSLLARLTDAMDVADWFCSPIETVTASMHGLGMVGASESVRGLDGHLTAHVRGADGRTAAITVSSNGAAWLREVILLGPAGRLRVTDGQFEWLDGNGKCLDAHTGGPSDAPRLAAQRLRELVAGTARAIASPAASRLTPAHTALLSCRTGHTESCHRVGNMLAR